ncbi:hypothetical protein LguiB_020143 [Lonicera macranthoides]
MKIQCEFCYKAEASVFCSADEAALCHGCDHRVHHANKLAGKHHRFSLLPPFPKHFPLCDICQEKRAFLFCQEDRAVLCEDCDVPIHKANEHTQKHNRFLLTGVKLSPTSSLYSSSSSSVMDGCDVVPHLPTQKSSNKLTSLPPPVIPNNSPSLPKLPTTATIIDKFGKNNQVMNGVGNGSTSSISEYLIDMLPGWRVEDFLDSSSTPSTFLKTGESDLMPFWDAELEGTLSSFSWEKMGLGCPKPRRLF